MRHAPFHLVLTVAAGLSWTGVSETRAQQQPVDWITPQGGLFDVETNWSPRIVPGTQDLARFDLEASFLVQGTAVVSVGGLVIGDSDVRWRQEAAGSAAVLDTGQIRVGNGTFDKPRRLDAPGRLTLVGPLQAYTNSIGLGTGLLASQLVIGPDVRILAGQMLTTPAASLGIVLGGDPQSAGDPRLYLVGGATATRLDGGLVVGTATSGSGNQPLASRHVLIASKNPVAPESFPFVVSRPPTGRTFEFEVGFDQFGTELVAKVDLASSIVDVAPTGSSDLVAAPRRIVAADLDGDGREELVVLVDEQKVSIFPALGNGQFGSPIDYPAGSFPADVAVGDFDGDGTTDLALGGTSESGAGVLSYLLNPANDPSNLESGPSTTLADPVRSLATTSFPLGQSLASARGVTVTSSDGSTGAGRATGYVVEGSEAVKVAEIEIGEDPGPSDPIEDENKKDPDPPIGVGSNAAAANARRGGGSTPVLQVLVPTFSGYQPLQSIPLTGRAVDFVCANLDGDQWIDCLVITENGHLDLVHPTKVGTPGARAASDTRSIPLGGRPTAIALGDIDGDGDREIVIGLADPGRIEILQSLPDALFPNSPEIGHVLLERVYARTIGQTPLAVAATDDGSVVIGLDSGSSPSIDVGQVEVTPVPACVRVDLNDDGEVNSTDLGLLLQSWGPCLDCAADLDGNGVVNAQDLGLLYVEWGPCG